MATPPGKCFRFIDLFCGIGGFRIALENQGHSCVFSSDWDPDAQGVYQLNFGELPFGDLTKLPEDEIPEHDLLCGGFPCQPFSISGKMRGFGDARGTLLHEVLRLAHSRKPAVVLLENVRNYLSHDGGQTHSSTLRLLEQCGYSVYFQVLNSSDYGVPQKRQRLFYVCFRKDLQVSSFSFPEPSKRSVCLEDILLCDDDPCLQSLYIERSDLRMKELPNAPENRPLRIGTVGKGGQGERVYSPMGHAVTLSAYGGGIGAKTGMYLVKDRIRRLHPQECRRLMGFPEEFKLHQRFNVCYKQFGNSVVIPVVEAIVKKIEQALFQTNLEMA